MEKPAKNKIEKENPQADLQRSVRKMFLELQDGQRTPEQAEERASLLVNAPEFDELLSAKQRTSILEDFRAGLVMEEEKKFIDQVISSLQPLLEIQQKNPELYEDVQARISMEAGGFTQLNKRMSYGVTGSSAHIHLAPSYHVKDRITELFLNGMQKLAEVVQDNEKIQEVTATSWLMATKTYGQALEGFGFEIGEVPDHVREEHFKGEEREIKRAFISRDRFLEKFGE